jgi:hypothetical protein
MSSTATRTDVQALIDLFQRTMWLPDPGIVTLVLGVVAANRLPGDPVWLLVVGPPSSGKTEVLGALYDLPECHPVSSLTEAGLLSGSLSKDQEATGGLLLQLGDRGLVLAPDFGTVLTEHASTRNRLFACLREVYDGRFVRRLGTAGGRTFAWRGHAGLIGACTEVIDTPAIDLGLLGERFTYYRIPRSTPDDDFVACLMAAENAGRQAEIRAERAAAVARFFEGLVLPDTLPPLPDAEHDRLSMLATLGARLRSPVVRDGYSRTIETVPGHERPMRLFAQLRQVHAGMAVIGTPAGVLWRLLAQVALGGTHPGRRSIVEDLLARPGAHATSNVAGHCGLPNTTARRHLEDLVAHGVLVRTCDDPELWEPSEWLTQSWWAVRGTERLGPDGSPPVVRADESCPICNAPPPRRGVFGVAACVHQIAVLSPDLLEDGGTIADPREER